jgi:CelD/BcsL family acetyltransferase involved in cellulose biosynthesis
MTTAALTEKWTAEVRSDLDGLRPEWTDLFRRCGSATPFQSYAWNRAWWNAYGRPKRLRVVLVRRGGMLVAAGAFMRAWRGGCAVLVPVGGAFSDFLDVLADDACRAEAVAEFARVLTTMPGWHAVDFPETRPDGVATELAAHMNSRVRDASLCLEIAAQEFQTLVRDLPAHARKTVKRRVNQLAKLGVDVREVGPEQAERSTVELLRLHRDQWQGRAVNTEHLKPAFAAHLTSAVPTMIADGQAVLLEYHLDGAHVASNLVVVGTDLAGGYLYGADPSLRDKLDVTTLLISTTLPVAARNGCAVMSMLRGAEPYKQRWRPAEVVNRRVVLVRAGSPRGHAYASAVRARAAVGRVAKTRAPWLRTVRDRVKAVVTRSGVTR